MTTSDEPSVGTPLNFITCSAGSMFRININQLFQNIPNMLQVRTLTFATELYIS